MNRKNLNFSIVVLIVILAFMFIGNALSIYIERQHSDMQHRLSVEDRSSIKQEQDVSRKDRNRNHDLILKLEKRINSLENSNSESRK